VALLELGAELAALRRDPAQLARMPEVLKRIKAGGGELPQIAGHLVGWIFSAAGNERLTQTWERTQGPVRLYIQRAATSAKGKWPDLDEQARALLDGIAAGDAAGARQRARDLTRNMAAKLGLDVGLPPMPLMSLNIKTNAKEKSRG
jgi:DNA-binding FadR family transcriptional regulator